LAQKRIERERAVTDEMIQAASAQGLSLEEYKEKLQATQKDEEEAYKKREETLKKYTDTATNMFNRLDDKSKLTVNQMTANMKHNQSVMEKWADNLTALAERGINQGLLERLRAAGPESAGTVAALVRASDKELEELNTVFANGSQVATDALLKQLGLPEVVNSGADMVDDIAAGVDNNANLSDATARLIQSARTSAQTAVTGGGFDDIGGAIVDGVYKGFQAREAWFKSQITTFFRKTVNDVKSELGIRSPSSVFAAIGEFMAQGLGVGFEKQMNQVSRDMQKAIPQAFDIDTELNTSFNPGMNARGRGGASGSVYHQNISVTSPKALSEREIAREFKNLSRKLAMGAM
jgi:DNA-binding transcriptional MerR regulator